MTTGDVRDQVRRWKLIALASALVALAAVAGLIGWVARGLGEVKPIAAPTFTGGGWVAGCDTKGATDIAIGTAVRILSADDAQLAVGKVVADRVWVNGSCRQEFVVDGIPGGRSVYLIEVGRWRHTVSEAALRGNIAEIMLV